MRLVPHAGAPDRPPAPRSPCPPWAPLPATSALAPGCSQPCGGAGRCWTWPAPSPARCSQVPPCGLVRGPVWPEGRGQAVRCPGSSADADTDGFCVLVTLWRPSSVTFQGPGHVSQGPRGQSGKGGQPVVATCWVTAGPGSPPTGDPPRLLAAIGACMAVGLAPATSPLEGLCGLCPPGSSGPACSGRAPVSGPSRRDLAPPFPQRRSADTLQPEARGVGGGVRRRLPRGQRLLTDLVRGLQHGRGGCRASFLGDEGA